MLRRKLACVGACVAAVAILDGCRDPGAAGAPVMTPSGSGSIGSATLSWEAPTSNTNGTPLTDLAGYRIYYGSSRDQLSHTVQIKTVGLQTYVIDDLEPGIWYFAVKAVASNGTESTLSDIVAKTIT